ncbi:glycosyltransferase family 2 protein [Hymenobacter lapidiphilus]|uniref:Glycosyltransferase n=1 Tax=Hymenobacter lapidiphilus TaxID=2608003 RepID=A0A7Y7PQ90_9BACT|nr:glycosyltransferase [Hymenobacter lapidiphilus]NVO32018.1 glycosyltransferase [Hymenobacter lapidiphilus]
MPLVTIIALCYNHARFLEAALDSILAQTYPHLEVVLVDDASTDGSADILRRYAAQNPGWQLLLLPENQNNCRAFNRGLALSKGEFVIDFATDDVLLPERITRQVAAFEQAGPRCGVVYTDAELLDESGRFVRHYYRRDAHGRLHPRPASGFVFADVLERYFISTPTMLMRRATLDTLGGYDESLSYEDFDFWVRASRDWEFQFLDIISTQKHLHPRSKSAKSYRRHDPHLASTIVVCRKALALCRTPEERAALVVRVRWELRQALRHRSRPEARALYQLLGELGAVGAVDWGLFKVLG